MKYNLVEVFESLQGEGRNMGRKCVFVRFAGCNLACPWCDTDIKKSFEISLADLVKEICSYKAKMVVLTGGEPTMAKGVEELVKALKEKGFFIAVETNGTNGHDECPWLQFVDYIACSPKAEYPHLIKLDCANEVRIVASSEDVAAFCERVKTIINADDYYISPCDRGAGDFDFGTAKSVLSRLDASWALSVQMHKLLGFR
jgi:organic radical activating enzyme